ncbi:hypothetical protein [Flammeovirga aprica]|nr:hypothetical protein [Flammeovirga aprica]
MYTILVVFCAKVVARITTLEVNDTVLVANVLFASILSMMIVKAYLKNKLNEVEKAEKRCQSLENQLLEATNIIKSMKHENQSLESDLETSRFDLQTLKKKHDSLDRLFEETTHTLEEQRNVNLSLRGEVKSLRNVEKSLNETVDKLNNEVLQLESKTNELQIDLRSADETLAVQRNEIESLANVSEDWKKKYKSIVASASRKGIKLADLQVEKVG